MCSTPLTIREYAYVSITGPGTHENITEVLGLQPSEAWNVGETNGRTGRPRRQMRWMLYSGLDDTHPLNQHIELLFLRLKTKADALRLLWIDYDLTLVCVGHFPQAGHGSTLIASRSDKRRSSDSRLTSISTPSIATRTRLRRDAAHRGNPCPPWLSAGSRPLYRLAGNARRPAIPRWKWLRGKTEIA